MEKHKCKLCLKSFANGRALGGHMRSHMMNLPIQSKPEPPIQLRDEDEDEDEALSASSSSSSSSSEEEGEEEKGLSYGLRENPKKSFRLVDPEFSFAIGAGSVVLQDRESETESSKNPTRRRSKRTRKLNIGEYQCQQKQEPTTKKVKSYKLSKAESWVEPEPVSSISDATTEEDVAFCLMMLSRDKWKKEEDDEEEEEEEVAVEKSMDDSDESEEIKLCKSSRVRGKYKCETCKKTFRSYQALGGHRASHKKIRVSSSTYETQFEQENAGTTSTSMADRKIHECPVCYRVFASGQALGGHKRSHVTGSSTTPAKNSAKFGDNLIDLDLNLPAPMDDDDISQIELSAVSDAEFVNHIK